MALTDIRADRSESNLTQGMKVNNRLGFTKRLAAVDAHDFEHNEESDAEDYDIAFHPI